MTPSDTSDSRWEAFSAAERSEILLGLDRRLTEAENGNAYVWWDVVVKLMRELAPERAEIRRDLDEREARARAATP